jgi:hypothetical protein
MLGNQVFIHKDITLFPAMQHSDLLRNGDKTLEIVFWDRRSVAVQLFGDGLAGVEECKAGEEGGQLRPWLCTNGGQTMCDHYAFIIVHPFPGCVRASIVPRDLCLNLSPTGSLIITFSVKNGIG